MEGKIYKLSGGDRFYYGSTKRSLNLRKNEHYYKSKHIAGRRLYKYFNSIGWDNVTIELVEAFSCESKAEILAKENEYINKYIGDTNCLNSILALN